MLLAVFKMLQNPTFSSLNFRNTPEAMQQTVKNSWVDLFRNHGFTPAEIERLRTCFIAVDESLQNEDHEGI